MELTEKQINLLGRIDSRGTAGRHDKAAKILLKKGLIRYLDGIILLVTEKGNAILKKQGRGERRWQNREY
jgi:hypothetical protein